MAKQRYPQADASFRTNTKLDIDGQLASPEITRDPVDLDVIPLNRESPKIETRLAAMLLPSEFFFA